MTAALKIPAVDLTPISQSQFEKLNKRARLVQRMSLPMEAKVRLARRRIKEWIDHHDGEVYGSFSGGKDSLVLMFLIWSVDPTIPGVFSNTGLEYPEVVALVKRMKAAGYPIEIIRPKKTFRQVVLEEGFPLVSKTVAEKIQRVRRPPDPKNENTRRLYMTGIRSDGVYRPNSKIPEKWMKLIDAPFGTTNKCCEYLKKEPFRRYERETGRHPMQGVMIAEGGPRAQLSECNAFTAKRPISSPMLYWTEEDVWEYIKTRNLAYAEVYDDRVVDGVEVKGESRTGCMFCAYGAHLEKGENRFQRMALTHPKLWNYCMNKLGMGAALDYIRVSYRPVRGKLAEGCGGKA